MLFIYFFNKNTVLEKILSTFSFLISSGYLAVPAEYESHEYLSHYAKCTITLSVWHMANSVCLESCVAAKLASEKAALLLPQFWLSVGLIREEQGYRRLDWSRRKCLLKIRSSFPSFSLCDNIWSNSELLLLMIGTAFLSWGNLCLCPTNLVATVAQAFMGISNSLGLLWQHLTCIPCCRMCNTALKDKLKWQLLVTLPASLESLTGCQLEPVLFMCNKIPV